VVSATDPHGRILDFLDRKYTNGFNGRDSIPGRGKTLSVFDIFQTDSEIQPEADTGSTFLGSKTAGA
jgi:hypothetical protein